MTFATGNPVPSHAPEDLDDNADVLDNLMAGEALQYPDRLGVVRLSWKGIEQYAQSLNSPNVLSLAGLGGTAGSLLMFSAPGTLTLTPYGSLAPKDSPTFTGNPTAPTPATSDNDTSVATTAFVQAAITALIAGSPALLNTLKELADAIGDDPNFAATMTTALALKAPLDSPALTGNPSAPTPAVGTNSTRLATAAMVQAEIANKRAWTTFTPTVTSATGTYTSASATGKYMVMFGVCYFTVTVTITTKGTGAFPVFTIPVTGLAGLSVFVNPAQSGATLKSGVARFIDTGRAQVWGADATDLVTADGQNIIISGYYPVA